MVRFGVLTVLAASASAARVNVRAGAEQEMSLNASMEHPIPTPPGYTFNWDMVYGCYAGALAGANMKIPPGYKKEKDTVCPGRDIKKWRDGSDSQFGQVGDKNFRDIVECAKECNRHDECAGFHMWQGQCSNWKKGELQDLKGRSSREHDCYVKWEVRDLSGNVVNVPKDEPAPPQPVPEPEGPQVSDCLCVWDIDRTLTAKQGWDYCPGTKLFPGVHDYAYSGGKLILSDLMLNFNNTFCNECYFAAVSAGTASGPSSMVRTILDGMIQPKYNVGGWVDGCPTAVWGTKVMCCGEGQAKVNAVTDISKWLAGHDIHIPDENVHFFDDKANNIEAFAKSKYNAHQVSCASRDGNRGGCGGVREEVVDTKGAITC